jgi:hypothetical protein
MTACTQPRCIATIVDGYCDVCGSPAGAAPLAAAASAASADLSTGCSQPECTGTIVDGYCDVCGSAAGAAPFISAAATASAASSTPANEPDLPAVPASTPASATADEETPTHRITRGKALGQQVSTEIAARGAAAPGAVHAQKTDGEKEVAQGEPDHAQEYRRRVKDAQRPDEVLKGGAARSRRARTNQ